MTSSIPVVPDAASTLWLVPVPWLSRVSVGLTSDPVGPESGTWDFGSIAISKDDGGACIKRKEERRSVARVRGR
jgi:hypothetical protein